VTPCRQHNSPRSRSQRFKKSTADRSTTNSVNPPLAVLYEPLIPADASLLAVLVASSLLPATPTP
jgi:hypothetical protein